MKVTAKGTVRVSVAGLCCYRPGERSRLIYRTLQYRGRKGQPKGFREPDLIRLLDAAHQQLQAPIVLVWDGLSAHKTPPMRAAIAARSWLRVYQLAIGRRAALTIPAAAERRSSVSLCRRQRLAVQAADELR